MTHRERMLAAYRGKAPDQVPVSPELWYDVAVGLDPDCSWQDISLGTYPLWKAQLRAHQYFDSSAWVIAAPVSGEVDGKIKAKRHTKENGDLELHYVGRCAAGTLTWKTRSNEKYNDWMVERPIKNLAADLEPFIELFMPDPGTLDYSEIADALEGVKEDGVVTAYVGALFFDFLISHMAQGADIVILQMLDDGDWWSGLHAQYLDWLERRAMTILERTQAEILILVNGYSTAELIGPDLYRRWELPLVQSVARKVHAHGKLLHLHQHGKSLALLDILSECGADLIEPFERPPTGDTADLAQVRRRLGGSTAIRGNLDARNVLLHGTGAEVERQAKECIDAAAAGGGFILASGDGVIVNTPPANIFKMVKVAQTYGKY